MSVGLQLQVGFERADQGYGFATYWEQAQLGVRLDWGLRK
jgi:hypothetical protein